MRIFWQSFVDQATSAPYMARLASYLNEIAAPGTSVHVEGITPADRDFGRLSEFRCAIQAVDNGLAAQESGFDAYVMGHFQDPGLYELRSALTIPVVGTGEATLLAASQLGRRLGLVTLDAAFEVWHYEQADRYGLSGRVAHVTGMGCRPEDFSAAFAGDAAAKARMLTRLRGLRAAAGRSRRRCHHSGRRAAGSAHCERAWLQDRSCARGQLCGSGVEERRDVGAVAAPQRH